MHYIPSKCDTSLLISMSGTEVYRLTSNIKDMELYNLFNRGLNVIFEADKEARKDSSSLDIDEDNLVVSQHGM